MRGTSLLARRSTRRPILLICLMLCTLLLTSRVNQRKAKQAARAAEDKLSLVVSRLYSGFQDVTPNEDYNELTLPGVAPRQGQQVYNYESAKEKIQEHKYKSDGLLELNPAGKHPIYELVKRAQDDWDNKIKSSSKTLDEAVRAYQSRYKRLPPKGFDHWWAYVQKKNVKLPDEYDQIYRDLEPLWGMHPRDLQKLQRDWEGHSDTYTIGKDSYEDELALKNFSFSHDNTPSNKLTNNAYELINLLEEIADKLPPFHAVFTPHDNPDLHTDYEVKQKALEAAQSKTYVDTTNLPPHNHHDGWIAACAPSSAAYRRHIRWNHAPPPRRVKTFIHNHRAAMDPCAHPSHFLLHGQFISHHRGPVPQRVMFPQFSFSPTLVHNDITLAMPINWVDDLPRKDNPAWNERPDARLQWRGSNTGIWHAEGRRWDLAHRARLVSWSADGVAEGMRKMQAGDFDDDEGDEDELSVLMPVDEGRAVGHPVPVSRAKWAPAMTDIAFAGRPLNCPPDVCAKLEDIFEFRKKQNGKVAGRYKYYVDVDGNGWSSRFKRLITSNGLVFKSTIYPEWYTDRVAPWVHYVPIQVDLSDLWDALTFFRGGPSGDGAHDEMARKIGDAGRQWSRSFWRKEDMVAYNFRLFLEYGRVMNIDRDAMSFDPDSAANQDAVTEHRHELRQH